MSSPLPSLLDTYSLSMSSVGCKALYMVISFFDPFVEILPESISRLISSILQGRQPRLPLMKFLLQSLVSRSFLVRQRYSFYFSLHFPLLNCVCFQYSHVLISFLLFSCSDFLLILFLPLFVFFHFSLLAWHIFLCQIPFLYPDCIFLLFVFESFFIFRKQLDVVHVH